MKKNIKPLALIGYSGHAFVAYDIAKAMGLSIEAYCDQQEKINDPYKLSYLGNENDQETLALLKDYEYFIIIGDNYIRKPITLALLNKLENPINVIHSTAILTEFKKLNDGVMVVPNAIIGVGKVLLRDIENDEIVVGNLQKKL